MSELRIYLRNHEAAAQAGRDLFRRSAQSQRSRPWGGELQGLTRSVEADVRSLRQIMRAVSVSPDRVAGLVLRAGERMARLKPNGHFITRSPLSDLIEIEGLLDAVRAKQAGWHALAAANALSVSLDPILEDLLRRAESQVTQLQSLHQLAAKAALSEPSAAS